MSRPRRKIMVFSVFTLAFWQLRRTKWMLGIVELGVLASVTFVCAALIYSQIMVTAGLQEDLHTYPDHTSINVTANVDRPFLDRLELANTAVNAVARSRLSPYITQSHAQFSMSTGLLSILSKAKGMVTLKDSDNEIIIDDVVMNGVDVQQSASHLHIIQGRLPQNVSQSQSATHTAIEVAITSQTATALHLTLGATLKTTVDVVQDEQLLKNGALLLKVVGIIQAPTASDLYWSHTLFNPVKQAPGQANSAFTYYALTSNSALISTVGQYIPAQYKPGQASAGTGNDDSSDITIVPPLQVSWSYSLNANTLKSSDLNPLLNALQSFQDGNAANSALSQQYGLAALQTVVPITALQNYQDQIAIAQIPAFGLILTIFCLLLYFVSLMAELLVERQAGAIAIFRSRGASRWQVFSALLLQGGILTLIALIVGPLLSFWVARWMALLLLPGQDQAVINFVLLGHSQQVFFSVFWYVVAIVVLMLLILVIVINRTTALDVLAIRWEASRSTQRPLWLKWNFDVMAVVITVLGYGISFYLLRTNVLDARLRLLLLSPLILARTIFTVLAAVLLFLRFFPTMLRFGSWLTTRSSSGAASMISLAQLARAPRQSVRMTMLLSLATAFSMFALVFYASQLQRAQDVAAHTVGADFSATLPAHTGIAALPGVLSLYGHLPGVLGTSAGSSTALLLGDQHVSINVLAVDAATYAQTANWPQDASTQPLASLMQQLVASRSTALTQQGLPAIIDSALAHTYHLSPGSRFTLSDASDANQTFYFHVLAIAAQIPTLSSPDGILIDLQGYAEAYARVYVNNSPVPFQLSTVWLRTTDNAAELKAIRATLAARTTQMLDRRQLVASLHQEPLYLQVMGVLLLGPAVALLLILIGNLVASWMSARDRLTNFALLRALGAAPRTIANTLIWEQVIVYATSIILGVIFGGFLSWMVVPSLLFTSATGQQASDDIFFFSQSIPPIQIIIPALLIIGLVLLIVICILALGMMVRIVSKPSMAMMLRLNDD